MSLIVLNAVWLLNTIIQHVRKQYHTYSMVRQKRDNNALREGLKNNNNFDRIFQKEGRGSAIQ